MRKTLHNTLLSLLHTFLFCLSSSSWKKKRKKNTTPQAQPPVQKNVLLLRLRVFACLSIGLSLRLTHCVRACVRERECKYRLLWHCMFIVPMKLLELNWVEFREREWERKSRWRIKCECRTQWCLGQAFFFFTEQTLSVGHVCVNESVRVG